MIKVVFWGTPNIGVKTLKYLAASKDFDVAGVVTQPDKPAGRGNKLMASPIKKTAIELNIPVFQPISIRKDIDIQTKIKNLNADFFVTFAFGQILSQEVLDIPKYETINLHASLLPRYRGANPIQRCIINGDKKTGICTMITELGLDCGDVCMSYPIDIPDDMTCEDLYKIIADKSPALISDTLKGLYNGTLKPVKQCEEGACIASKLKSDEFKIDWTKTACEIHNLIRGVYKSPGAYFCFNGKNIKVMNSCVISQQSNCKPGTIICVGKDGIDFATGNGVLRITRVKPESKGEMAARDWYNGVKNTIGVLVK